MRVLLALDGSPASDAARRLVASLPWPEGTFIHVVGAIAPMIEAFTGFPGEAGLIVDVEPPSTGGLKAILDEACESLEAPGRIVRRSIVSGRPASVIVDEATALSAELVVVGSRGRGPMRSMVLGSVSAEVVDHAPCPVLVVRQPVVTSILFATDGSASARGALEFLAAARYLGDRPVQVLSVGQRPGTATPIEALYDSARPVVYRDSVVDREHVEAKAAHAVQVLRAAGHPASWTIAAGDPAHEIVEAAMGFRSDLIVVGSRGNTGFDRLLLGSVARNVLLHSSASVLIVREPIRERATEVVRERVADAAGVA
jgi:nucleotide-binding universal stress UspA family protein